MFAMKDLSKEIIQEIINKTLNDIETKRPGAYILLLAGMHMERNGWGKFIFNGSNSLAPAVLTLDDHIKTYLRSRNRIKSRLPLYDGLLLYAHIWETYWFQLKLLRIANLISGQNYPWFIPGTRTGSDFFEAGFFYENQVLKPLEHGAKPFADLLRNVYRRDLRNHIAHGDFFVHSDSISFGYREYSTTKSGKGNKNNNDTLLPFTAWNNLLDRAICFYETLNKTIYQRQISFIKAHPSGSIEIELPIEINATATLEWSSEKSLIGYFIPKSPFITRAGLYQTEEEKQAHQQLIRDLTASLSETQTHK